MRIAQSFCLPRFPHTERLASSSDRSTCRKGHGVPPPGRGHAGGAEAPGGRGAAPRRLRGAGGGAEPGAAAELRAEEPE